MADLFVSYARSDAATAGELAAHLAGCGWSVWFDPEIPAGMSWREVIAREIDAARCVVVLWSKRSVTSHWVLEEATYALGKGTLVPVAMEPDVQIPFGFTTIQAAPIWDWVGQEHHAGLERLEATIARKVAPARRAPPEPERPPAVLPQAREPAPQPSAQRESAAVDERPREPQRPEPEVQVAAAGPAQAQGSEAGDRRQPSRNERFVDLSAMHWTGYPVIAVFLACVLLVAADLVARLVLRAPLFIDITFIALIVGICAIGGAAMAAGRGKLPATPAADFVSRWLGIEWLRHWINAILGVSLLGVTAFEMLDTARAQASVSERFFMGEIPRAPFTFVLAGGFALLALATLKPVLDRLRGRQS